MKIEKELAKVGITPLNKITATEKYILITQVIRTLVNTFSMFNNMYSKFCMKLYGCNMYRAIINPKLNKVNYFYKNKSLYFEETLGLEEIDENIIHECIHYLQDVRKNDKTLYRIGLAEFNEYKVVGLGLNEIVLQYIANKMLYPENLNKENLNKIQLYENILLKEIIFIVGEETLVSSAINANEEFEEKFMETFQEEKIYYQLTAVFDKFLEAQQMENISDNEDIFNMEERLYTVFEKIQYDMFQKYFSTLIKYINTLEEIEDCKNNILEYRKLIYCNPKEEVQYDKYIQKKLEILDKKFIEICRKNSKNTLVVVHNNPIINLINGIKKVFLKNESHKTIQKED